MSAKQKAWEEFIKKHPILSLMEDKRINDAKQCVFYGWDSAMTGQNAAVKELKYRLDPTRNSVMDEEGDQWWWIQKQIDDVFGRVGKE